MAIALAPKPEASRKRVSNRRTVFLSILLILVTAAGIFVGLRLESIHASQERELQSLQSEKSALDAIQESQLRAVQEADARRMLLQSRIELQEERLKNQDGFLR